MSTTSRRSMGRRWAGAGWVWALALGGLLAGCCSGCPPPCSCPPATLVCRGCPEDYLILANDTQVLSVTGCRDIQYFLKLHRPHVEGEQVTTFVLHKLEITDSLMDKIPASYVNNDYPIQSLNLSNNSIESIDAGLEADNLTHLDLSRNRLSFIGNRTFSRMNNLLYLDLSANKIKDMSVDSFSGLRKLAHLDISRNNLSILMDAMFFPLISLQQLNLSYNMLEILSEKCFGSLLLLQQLDVSYNRLTSVAPGTLQFLPNLAKLLLADNPQLKPDAQIFVGTGRRLQQVDASRTGLRRVPEALTHSVRYLSLAGNRISTLRCGDLDGYPLLHMLDFADNIIEYVEDDALGRLEMISRLFLNKNKLRTVPKMLPDKLSYLSIDRNLIENLTIIDFATLTNLKALILSNNMISYIQENAFAQLTSLEILDVSNNPLKVLTPNTFGGPLSLKNLHIAYVNISAPARDISFPVPSPERIESLYLEHSPGLTRQLLADSAALAAIAQLQYLDISYSNITNIRSDLLHFFPQLKVLRLEGNELNCSDLNWLADWMRENLPEEYKGVKCSSPIALEGKLVVDLPPVIIKNISFSTEFSQKSRNKSINLKMININNIILKSIKNYALSKEDANARLDLNASDTNTIKEIQENIKEFFKSQKYNASNTINVNKANQMNTHYHVKSLLDFQNDDQHHMNFKLPKKEPILEQKYPDKSITRNPDVTTDKPQLFVLDKKPSMLLNADLSSDDISSSNRGSTSKKINKLLSVKNPPGNFTDKNKLIEIFSQLSHKENNSLNITNVRQKINPTTQESVSLCFANGNLNGTENKTKCSQHPEIAPELSENHENKNIKQGRFIYRKNVNFKSSNNTKPKKSKYVSKPNENLNISKDFEESHSRNNQTNIESRQNTDQNQRIKLASSSVFEQSDANQHKASNFKLNNPVEGKSNKTEMKASDLKEVFGEEKLNPTNISNQGDTGEGDIKERNKKIIYFNVSKILKAEFVTEVGEHEGENVSEHQTSRFRAEENTGSSSLGFGALVGVMGAACAALAGALLAKRRPQRRGTRAPEMMEVQTISAVGELW